MRKNIIIISVSAVVALVISVAAFVFLPKYFKNSFSAKEAEVKKTTSQSKKISSSSAPAETNVSLPTETKAQPAKKATKKSAAKTFSQESRQEDTADEKVTKTYKPAKKSAVKTSNMSKESFYDETSGKELPYRLYIPKNFDKTRKYPLFLFLHGAGERGDDNYSHINPLSKAFAAAGDFLGDCIIVAPQCPKYGWWSLYDYDEYGNYNENGWLGAAMRLTRDIAGNYNADSDRIYVSGLSMGGIATWELLETYPNFFAAGVPICGKGNSNAAYILKDIPVWIYHGTADDTIPFSASLEMYDAIRAAGGNMAELKSLYGVGHNAWDYAFAERELFCWLFAQNRNKALAGDCSYKYTEKIKLVSPSGETLFSEKDIRSFSMEFWSDGLTRIAAALETDANENLVSAYEKNKNKTFSVYYYGELLYKFIPLKPPEHGEFLFADCANDYLSEFIS